MMNFCVERDLIFNPPPILVGLIMPIELTSNRAHKLVNGAEILYPDFLDGNRLNFCVPPLLVRFINSIEVKAAQHSSAPACNHLFLCTKLEIFLGDGLAL